MGTFYLKSWAAWAPEFETKQDWSLWAKGEKSLTMSNSVPGLKHMAPVARRRLSQLTKMILEVGHELTNDKNDYHIIFSSEYGEITQQNKISNNLLLNDEVKPSIFSLSVFNAPVSLLSIHENIKEAATVILSGENGLHSGLLTLITQLTTEDKDVLLIFADEMLPEDYMTLGKESYPYCFGCLISNSSDDEGRKINYELNTKSEIIGKQHPLDFLKWLLLEEKCDFSIVLDESKINFKC